MVMMTRAEKMEYGGHPWPIGSIVKSTIPTNLGMIAVVIDRYIKVSRVDVNYYVYGLVWLNPKAEKNFNEYAYANLALIKTPDAHEDLGLKAVVPHNDIDREVTEG